MASRKTQLEMERQMQGQIVDGICVGCGALWSTHLKKNPGKHGYRERLKKFSGLEHRRVGTLVRKTPKPTKAERRAYKKSLSSRRAS